jgi:3-hydroxyacyl-CoA dehydrogenase/enoyl-CoA hydratase/3-hydroxybutyryl-CoA epimerase/enoyl-CoA isomerase
MAAGFPDRMSQDWKNTTQVLVANGRYGQKTGKGYYAYAPDKKGRPKKSVDPATYELLKDVVAARREFAPEEIVARCMVPMVNEVARCLEEKIVASPYEADMALLYGIGFPPFRGGACRYVDQTGVANVLATAEKLAPLGRLYEPPQLLRDMAAAGRKFFG